MAIRQISRTCKTCGRRTLWQKEVVGPVAGVVLTVLTCGLFLPLWGFAMLSGWLKPYRCQSCGAKRRL